jgi:antitoxin component of MazEF toxin-antitoxin module
LVSKNSRYLRVQSYGNTLAIAVAKPFAEELGIEKQSTVKTWVENGTFHARKAE